MRATSAAAGSPPPDLADVGWSLAASRARFEHRAVVLGRTRDELLDALTSLSRGQDSPGGGRYDVVFADPPYALADTAVSQVLSLLADQGWLAPGALVVVERATRSGPVKWPDGFAPDRARRYGDATFWYGLAPKSPRSPKTQHNDQASP